MIYDTLLDPYTGHFFDPDVGRKTQVTTRNEKGGPCPLAAIAALLLWRQEKRADLPPARSRRSLVVKWSRLTSKYIGTYLSREQAVADYVPIL